MKLSKLIDEANAALAAYGDIDVVVHNTATNTAEARQVIQVSQQQGENFPDFIIVAGIPEN